ncbi:MAG: hypothetical protein QOE54_5724 [Streptosporangiaceae bacterium]|jgi:hypothetical protein|nr:hypothetical protein [Streptosporangiaceae bacterium]
MTDLTHEGLPDSLSPHPSRPGQWPRVLSRRWMEEG